MTSCFPPFWYGMVWREGSPLAIRSEIVYTEDMETTTATISPELIKKMQGTAKNFTGYMIALAIVVWGFTFALMNVWLVVASLFVAMILGVGLFMTLTATLVLRSGKILSSE